MINPFRSEAEAYRFLLLTVGYFAAIAIAALAIGPWAGLVVFGLLTLGVVPRLIHQKLGEGIACFINGDGTH